MVAEPLKILSWEDPPPSPYGRPAGSSSTDRRYAEVAQQLREEPGRWAVVQEKTSHGSGLAHAINYGAVTAFRPPGDFEATYRRREGVTRVYARYLGDGYFG